MKLSSITRRTWLSGIVAAIVGRRLQFIQSIQPAQPTQWYVDIECGPSLVSDRELAKDILWNAYNQGGHTFYAAPVDISNLID